MDKEKGMVNNDSYYKITSDTNSIIDSSVD